VTNTFRVGDRSPRVAEARSTLARLGLLSGYEADLSDKYAEEDKLFDADLAHVLKAFQQSRGIVPSGNIDDMTLRELRHASYKLGSRVLSYQPNNEMVGDDVASLQEQLQELGFYSHRVDGHFGPGTYEALSNYQLNSGLQDDGVCGPDTVRLLAVIARQTGTGPGVSVVREVATLTAGSRSLADLRIVVGQFGGLSALTRQLVQALRQRSATVVASDQPDATTQAAAANRFAASVYIGFESLVGGDSTVHYFAVPQFESAGGRALAELVAARTTELVPGFAPAVLGMRLPVLRETRMPAVLLSVGPVHTALDHSPELVMAVVEALETWSTGTPPVGIPQPE